MHLRQPIAIFIDDVDRLGIGEIREVLKLIRNTAKFPNILYVVTMDKEYVAQQLGLVGIDGNLYLEKIFQLEISLPKMDDTEVLMTMRNELLAMTMSHKSVNDLFDDLPQETKGMVLSVVPTFRSAKRFARQFSTIFNFIRDTIGLREIDLFDLFYLELIHYFDRNTYFIMSTDIDKICKIEIDRQHNVLIYKIREGVIKSQIRTNDPLIKNKKTCFFLGKNLCKQGVQR
jgi:predicted KAP-like P-loop ATPase